MKNQQNLNNHQCRPRLANVDKRRQTTDNGNRLSLSFHCRLETVATSVMPERPLQPGLDGIVVGETAISTLADGLSYRGYLIEELAGAARFEEVIYLLLRGELPTAIELAAFQKRLADIAAIPNALLAIVREIPANTPLMDVMRTGCSLLAHWDDDAADNGREANLRKAERLVAQMPVLLATRHRMRHAKEPVAADRHRGFAENLLWMLNGREPSPQDVRAMEVSLITYAELEFNSSTFTARVVASTQSDMHSAITAAIGALKGPLHGGANEQVMDVLHAAGSADRAEAWVRDKLSRSERITGFGHRAYKQGDPRAALLKPLCAQLAAQRGLSKMEETADVIERVAYEAKNLRPNVDWPSARLYHYLGLPSELYTPLFVVARMAGWSAHVIEQLANNRLITPAARYIGPPRRTWVPPESR
jgi:2-methylcitrate synthase/citrate synthase II